MEEIIKAYVENIKVDTGRIGTKRVLIHPYAHLSKQLSSPRLAKEFLRSFRRRSDGGLRSPQEPLRVVQELHPAQSILATHSPRLTANTEYDLESTSSLFSESEMLILFD